MFDSNVHYYLLICIVVLEALHPILEEFPLSNRDSNYHLGNCFQQLSCKKCTHYSEIISK